MSDADRLGPEEYQPSLRWWSHAWRFVLMILIGAFIWASIGEPRSTVQVAADLLIGAAAFVLVCFRRRAPFTIAIVTAAASTFAASAAGPSDLAAVSLATTRRWVQVVFVGLVNFAAGLASYAIYRPEQPESLWVTITTNAAFTAAELAWGMYIGSRRELLWTLRARAERAEAEQERRVSQSKLEERTRIAREMHDVLAHRISQISMRAGALGYRDDLSADELREGVSVIRGAANQALTDLRAVLGVLRDSEGRPQYAPQPTYADIGELVDEARCTGLRIAYVDALAVAVADVPVPSATGRALYRIVQEGITNARKHAPGAELSIDVYGSPDEGISVNLSNPVGFGPTSTPGSGLGLIGLAERVALRGGRIEHSVASGDFQLRGWLPWTA